MAVSISSLTFTMSSLLHRRGVSPFHPSGRQGPGDDVGQEYGTIGPGRIRQVPDAGTAADGVAETAASRHDFAQAETALIRPVAPAAADQALGHDAGQGIGCQVGRDAHIGQADHGLDGARRMESTEDDVPCQGGPHGDARRLAIADFADDEDIRVLAQQGPQAVLEHHAPFGLDLALGNALHEDFHRVFQGRNADRVVLDLVDGRIESRRLTAARGPADEDEPLAAADELFQTAPGLVVHAQGREGQGDALAVEDADDDFFTAHCRQRTDPQVQTTFPVLPDDAPVLGQAAVGDVQAGQDFDAAHQFLQAALVEHPGLTEDTVPAPADADGVVQGLDVDVAGPGGQGVLQ